MLLNFLIIRESMETLMFSVHLIVHEDVARFFPLYLSLPSHNGLRHCVQASLRHRVVPKTKSRRALERQCVNA